MNEAATPAWLVNMYKQIDEKTEVTEFENITDDIEFRFGTAVWNGRERVREGFRQFDSTMDTTHVIEQFYDCGDVKMFRGHITFTPKTTGETRTSVIAHFLYMDAEQPDKVRRWFTGAGPFDLS